MAEVIYFVALPFVAADDSIVAGEPIECFNPVAVVMRAEALTRTWEPWPSAEPGIPRRRFRRRKDDQEVRRSAGRSKYVVGAGDG
jgi:hypothetical protein